MINFEQWEGFEGRIWKEEVNVRDFIHCIWRQRHAARRTGWWASTARRH